jgi:hypothetical protein
MSTKNAHFRFEVDGSSLPPNKIIRSVINLPCTLNKVRECRMGSQNGQSRETGNIGYIRRRQAQQKHNQYVTHCNLKSVKFTPMKTLSCFVISMRQRCAKGASATNIKSAVR